MWPNTWPPHWGIVQIYAAQKVKFSIKDFFSKCDQIRWKLQIWSQLLKKPLMKNFFLCSAPCGILPSGGVTLCVRSSQCKSPSYQVRWPLSRDLAKPHDQKFMWLYGKEPIKLSCHPAKFGGHNHSSGEDIKFLVCHLISQKNMIKGSSNLLKLSPWQVW